MTPTFEEIHQIKIVDFQYTAEEMQRIDAAAFKNGNCVDDGGRYDWGAGSSITVWVLPDTEANEQENAIKAIFYTNPFAYEPLSTEYIEMILEMTEHMAFNDNKFSGVYYPSLTRTTMPLPSLACSHNVRSAALSTAACDPAQCTKKRSTDMLTVKDVMSFLQALPPDMEVPAILAHFGGSDYLNLAFERQAVEDRQQQVQQESDEAYASYTSYRDAHRNVPVESELFMETQVVGDDLLSVFTEVEGRALAIRTVLEACIEAFVDSNMALLNKVEAEIAQLPQYGGRQKL